MGRLILGGTLWEISPVGLVCLFVERIRLFWMLAGEGSGLGTFRDRPGERCRTVMTHAASHWAQLMDLDKNAGIGVTQSRLLHLQA